MLALIPNTNTSFKLSAAREWMGAIKYDGNTAVSGEFGARASTIPVSVNVMRSGRKIDSYEMRMVNDPLLSPLLVQMAVFSSIDSTERTVGAGSIRITGDIDFENVAEPVRLDNLFSADNGSIPRRPRFSPPSRYFNVIQNDLQHHPFEEHLPPAAQPSLSRRRK